MKVCYSLLKKALQITHKSLLAFLLSAFFTVISYGQSQRTFLFDEVSFSLNKTIISGNSLKDSYGFGLGASLLLDLDKKLKVVTGVEYNRTRQFVNLLYFTHFSSYYDVSCSVNGISVPIGIRYNLGSKSAFFIESGIFSDLILFTTEKGMLSTFLPDKPGTNRKVTDRRGISCSYGIYTAAGIVIPVSHFKLLVKPEFKLGLREIYPNSDELINRYFKVNFGLRLN